MSFIGSWENSFQRRTLKIKRKKTVEHFPLSEIFLTQHSGNYRIENKNGHKKEIDGYFTGITLDLNFYSDPWNIKWDKKEIKKISDFILRLYIFFLTWKKHAI